MFYHTHHNSVPYLFVEFCLKSEKECDNYIIHSINHEMYLQLEQKSTLSPFDERQFYINRIESKYSG